jgi:putative tryptophan/tyrosine transport system substrate-binding protein
VHRAITAAIVVLVALPLAAMAQPAGKVYRIGLLTATSQALGIEPFRQGLRSLGYVEGQNVTIEYRSAEGRYDRLPSLAAELTKMQVDVIVAMVTQASLAARNATRTIPIVMVGVADPVGAGLVRSLARPGGNVTGTSFPSVEVAGKSLEVLTRVVPKLQRVAVLWNPTNPVYQAQMVKETEAAGRALRIELRNHGARDANEIDGAFEGDGDRAFRGTDRDRRRSAPHSSHPDRCAGREEPPPLGQCAERVCRGWRSHRLRAELD